MDSIRIEILNPKAKSLIKNLAEMKLIRIRKDNYNPGLSDLLKKLRKNSDEAISLEEITREVDVVRKARYEKQKGNS